ncbi:MAG TPA: hypothetical protein VKV73_11800 [Chloroflexota bacterium]|nr:hypothetical protein [Chloroflexota bacterium]
MVERTSHNGSITPAWSWDTALRGVIPPMISPLDEAGQVDVAAVGRGADYILDGGCAGLFVLAVADDDLTTIATILRQHQLLPMAART